MSSSHTSHALAADSAAPGGSFHAADVACAFGPSFFVDHLRQFVRDRCPDPAEHLPLVRLRLADGDTLNVCHIISVSPRWVMLAVRDAANHGDGMALELVPFESIRRVGIVTRRAGEGSIGFVQTHTPTLVEADAAHAVADSPQLVPSTVPARLIVDDQS